MKEFEGNSVFVKYVAPDDSEATRVADVMAHINLNPIPDVHLDNAAEDAESLSFTAPGNRSAPRGVDEDASANVKQPEEQDDWFSSGYDDNFEDDYDEDEYDIRFNKLYRDTGIEGTLSASHTATLTKSQKLTKKLDNKIYLDKVSSKTKLSKVAQNNLERSEKMTHTKIAKHTGRDDRATNESVLDPRTRLILFKFLNTGRLNEINGCISTGKEANVYHAVGKEFLEVENEAGLQGPQESPAATPSSKMPAADNKTFDYALKVYKTSILVFKDRDKYVQGNFRFNNYCKKNPRKMVKVWAEKEMRNLKRLQAAGIPCPRPLQLRSHVLLMDFIGHDGWPAPRLHDAKLNENR